MSKQYKNSLIWFVVSNNFFYYTWGHLQQADISPHRYLTPSQPKERNRLSPHMSAELQLRRGLSTSVRPSYSQATADPGLNLDDSGRFFGVTGVITERHGQNHHSWWNIPHQKWSRWGEFSPLGTIRRGWGALCALLGKDISQFPCAATEARTPQQQS